MNWRLLLVFLVVVGSEASAHPAVRHLYLLPDNRVRFDMGPPLGLRGLRDEIRKMKRENSKPDVQVLPDKRTPYAFVEQVLKVFLSEKYDYVGYTGIDSSK